MIETIKTGSREEWLELRKKYIGGSDASAVVGMNPYRSAYALWAEKTGKVAGFEGNLTTQVGAYLEEFVAKMFETETGKKVQRRNATFVNDLYPFACANVDRLVVGEDAVLEIKTTNSIPLMRTLRNSDEFPEAYYCQVVHYLAVTGKKKAYLAVLINCREFKVYELERDQSEIDALMDAEKEFWTHVESDTPPAVDGSQSASDTLQAIYPESNGETVDISAFNAILSERAQLDGQIKALTDLKKDCENKVKAFMKEAEKGESDKFRISYPSSVRRAFDVKAFAADYPTIDLDGYYKETTTRTFRVTEKGA